MLKIKSRNNLSKLWSRSYILMLLSNLFIYLGFYMLVPTLPAYAKLSGGSAFEAGLVVSVFSISSLICRLFTGNLSDKMEVKPIIISGSVILAVCTLSYIWLPLAAIILIRLIQGVGWGFASTGAASIFSDIVPESKRGEGMGYYSMSIIIAMSLATVAAIVIMNLFSFKFIALISIALVMLGAVLLQGVKIPKKKKINHKNKSPFSLTDLFEKKALLPSLLCFLLTITLCGIMSYIMLYGKEMKMHNIWIYFVGHVFMVLITRPFIGKIFDKRGHAVIVLPGVAALIIGLVILSYAHSTFTLVLASLFYGLGYGAVHPSLQVWAVNDSPQNRKGAANGTFLSSMDLGFTVGPIILGTIAQYNSYGIMYRVSSLFIVLFLAIYVFVLIKNKEIDQELDLDEQVSGF